jgi:hypothetical protein
LDASNPEKMTSVFVCFPIGTAKINSTCRITQELSQIFFHFFHFVYLALRYHQETWAKKEEIAEQKKLKQALEKGIMNIFLPLRCIFCPTNRIPS